MKTKLSIGIECGKNTCASKPGKFCPFLKFQRFGTVPVCQLFDEELEVSGGGTGWVMRHPKCIKLSSENKGA